MDFKIGSKYEFHRDNLVAMIKDKEIKVIDVESITGFVCYFCRERIRGRAELIIYDDGKAKETIFLHSRCYGGALLGEWDSPLVG